MSDLCVFSIFGSEEVKSKAVTHDKRRLLPRTTRVTALSLYRGNPLLFAFARDDMSLHVCEMREKRVLHEISFSQRGALTDVRYTHHPACILLGTNTFDASSGRIDRYGVPTVYDVHHNTEVQVYDTPEAEGRTTQRVPCLAVCPTSDNFLACLDNGSVAMYDFRSPKIVHEIEKPGAETAGPNGNLACWETNGTSFAVTAGSKKIHIFDIRMNARERSVDLTASLAVDRKEEDIISIAFSPKGKTLAIKRAYGSILSLRASGYNDVADITEMRRGASGGVTDDAEPFKHSNVTYTSTGHLVTGNPDGTVAHWANPHEEGLLLDTTVKHVATVGPIEFHPLLQVGVSACHLLYLWSSSLGRSGA